MRRKVSSISLLAATALLAACGGSNGDAGVDAEQTVGQTPTEVLSVVSASYPVHFFAEAIGGDRVDASLPLPDGTSPDDWTPAPEEVLAFQEADLILLNGADYEGWVTTASLPASRLVDTSAALEDEIIVVEDAVTHSHGPEGEHSHSETLSTTWLDPVMAIRQAEAVRDALAANDPEGASYYEARFEELRRDLEAVDSELQTAAGSLGSALGAVPGYEYLGRRYGFDVATLRLERGAAPTSGFWHDLEHAQADSGAQLILWPDEIGSATSERLAGYGLTPVVYELGGSRPASGDLLSVFRANAGRLGQAAASLR